MVDQSNRPDPNEYYPGRRIELNSHPRAVPYAGYLPGTPGEITEVHYGSDDDYCIVVKLDGFEHPETVKTSHVTLMPALTTSPAGPGDGP